MGFIDFCNKLIRYSFYSIFLLVPLIFTSNTSELFELNKMWLAWGLTILIGFGWISKMIIEKTITIKRTPLDIPLVIFLISQLISTIFSLDQRVSFFGYYSRFNGGFLSLFTYVFLYYAFVSNFTREDLKSFLRISIIAGVIVALWGLPSHFGNDPTCLMFRGTFDVSCWTDAFKPTVRIFSMLGQPAWLASYLALLLPIVMAYIVILSEQKKKIAEYVTDKKTLLFLIILFLFYIDLLFTNTRAGFLAFWAGNIFFWGMIFLRNIRSVKKILPIFIIINTIFIVSNGIFSTPIAQLNKFSLSAISQTDTPKTTSTEPSTTEQIPDNTSQTQGINITDSVNIRVLVWNGALAAWRARPIIGTGVETFAFAYYQFRPAAHNLTSEWDYLYNKAHNEYLNYLTTTGLLGLGSYLSIFIVLSILAIKKYFSKKSEALQNDDYALSVALLSSVVTILIANFFGFSVVITNIYLFFLPLWFFMITKLQDPEKALTFSLIKSKYEKVSAGQWTIVSALGGTSLFLIFLLIRFWQADVAYALGNNLDKVGDYQNAYAHVTRAAAIRPNEPVFQDELALNLATIATALYKTDQSSTAAQLATQAVNINDRIVSNHPNNVVYWKSRTRILYMLNDVNPSYGKPALDAILVAQKLAPTDAKISYNVGVIQGKNGEIDNAIKSLTQTIQLKKDYRDAYFARGLFLRQLATNENGVVINRDLADKGTADMLYILKNLNSADEEVIKLLKEWNVALP